MLGHTVAHTSPEPLDHGHQRHHSLGHHGHLSYHGLKQLLEVTVIQKTMHIFGINWILGLTKHCLAEM